MAETRFVISDIPDPPPSAPKSLPRDFHFQKINTFENLKTDQGMGTPLYRATDH